MKYLIGLIIVSALAIGLWFGFATYRRNVMLDSGRPLLLINTERGLYTYSDLISREDITRQLKVVAYADELTSEQIAEFTQGLSFFSGMPTQAGDTRGIAPVFSSQVLPTPQQQQRWVTVLTSLTSQQRDLCNSISDSLAVQYCLSRHVAYQAVAKKSPMSVCDALYVPDQQKECVDDVSGGTLAVYIDQNQNAIIDVFEQLAVPYEQRNNPRNLPVVNPTQ